MFYIFKCIRQIQCCAPNHRVIIHLTLNFLEPERTSSSLLTVLIKGMMREQALKSAGPRVQILTLPLTSCKMGLWPADPVSGLHQWSSTCTEKNFKHIHAKLKPPSSKLKIKRRYASTFCDCWFEHRVFLYVKGQQGFFYPSTANIF